MKSALIYFFILIIQVITIKSIYSPDAGFLDGDWTTNDSKFLMIILFTVPVSILMLHLDENKTKPGTVVKWLTGILSFFFPIMIYELAKSLDLNVVAAMCAAFLIGVYGLTILLLVGTRVKDIANSWLDKLKPKN